MLSITTLNLNVGHQITSIANVSTGKSIEIETQFSLDKTKKSPILEASTHVIRDF